VGTTNEHRSRRAKAALVTSVGSPLAAVAGFLYLHATSCSSQPQAPAGLVGMTCATIAILTGGFITPAIGWGQRVHPAAFFFGILGALLGCALFLGSLFACVT
jgi:hypothetical protein